MLRAIVLETKWLRILSLGGINKIRNHLVANPMLLNIWVISWDSSWEES